MPNWNDVLKELNNKNSENPTDTYRRSLIAQVAEKSGRNTICYYSAFLQKPRIGNTDIDDNDKNALMTVIHDMDKTIGLDLILHTPGGDIAATESIVIYLRQIFGTNIRVIVPQIAMSAGTMIACASREIILGKQSNLGPFDPQFGQISAQGVIEEFERAKEEVSKDPSSIGIWQVILSKYHPTFIGDCEKALKWAEVIVTDWLRTGMFEDEANCDETIKEIVSRLNSHSDTFAHNRHIHIDEAREIGLKVTALEDDNDFQDLVLTVHHIFMLTMGQSSAAKIIESHRGQCMVFNHYPKSEIQQVY